MKNLSHIIWKNRKALGKLGQTLLWNEEELPEVLMGFYKPGGNNRLGQYRSGAQPVAPIPRLGHDIRQTALLKEQSRGWHELGSGKLVWSVGLSSVGSPSHMLFDLGATGKHRPQCWEQKSV